MFKRILIAIAGLILAGIIYMGVSFVPIMAGMAAKTMCTCVFVLNRTPESVIEKELSVFPGLGSAKFTFEDSAAVTGQILWVTKKAIFRKGLGCTLLSERSEAEVRSQSVVLPSSPQVDQDTINWPDGNMLSSIEWPGVQYTKIHEAVDEAFAEHDPAKPKNTLAVVVVYKGQIIAEKYAEGLDYNSRLTGWSMTKSITNALVGILVKEGKLKVDEPAPVAAWANDDRKKITLNNLLQASSGLEWNESYFLPGDFHNMFMHSDDKGGYAAMQPLDHEPGTFWEYSSGTTNLLSKIIRQTVGDSAYYRFLYEKLFYRIGMHHSLIEPDASGTFVGSSYGYASARDWARLGLLYLRDGKWGEDQILPEGWVAYSHTPAPASPLGQYGAQFWLNAGAKDHPEKCYHPGLPNEEYGAEGFEGQYVFIIPSRELVVVRLGVSHHGFDITGLTNRILEALPGPKS